ncbi:HAD family hydrolase [Corynebacterium yudongzhengii]|uniref:Beta-phosphoglucomutase family hydrolase n=1 Tax=Corynebacterium yudongzhengii TaxID=2080740 RepID=A0A2U1T9X8_9CORY|nr:beta-phosphoglucomutase family hydrolase [Corynebacterium yudongzhengii]AWB81176.1 HAD family hydrolase [Corynebacterium yudongzhengii]PWC02715.1 beta-phosphoglucomutase family hydrolase [Corynebacterium yudongzhengii]
MSTLPTPAALVCDMDGVITHTAAVHAEAWKQMFDDALAKLAPDAEKFDISTDYLAYADGRTREDAVHAFMASRGVELSDDEITALGDQKQGYFEKALEESGVQVFDDAVHLVKRAREAGLPTALVTSSRNAERILQAAGLEKLFDVRVDGHDIINEKITGKPAPDSFLLAAERLNVRAAQCIALEDARSGVRAAFAAKYGLVIGVDRSDGDPDVAQGLFDAGADRVLADVSEIDFAFGFSEKHDTPRSTVFAIDGMNTDKLSDLETLFSTANGYWGTRANLPGTVDNGTHYPGSYLAGVFNRVHSDLTDSAGLVLESEHVPNIPDWTYLRVFDDKGAQLMPTTANILDSRLELDLRAGLSRRFLRVRADNGRRTRILIEQMTSIHRKHAAALRIVIAPENWQGEVSVRSAINGAVENRNVADDRALTTRHLTRAQGRHVDKHTTLVNTRTNQSDIAISIAARTDGLGEGTPFSEGELHGHDYTAAVYPHEPVSIEKIAAVFSSRDRAQSTPELQVCWELEQLGEFAALKRQHSLMWSAIWQVYDTSLPAGRTDALALRVNSFHILQSIVKVDSGMDAGLPARGLTAEGYRGHIFWDEQFVYPLLTSRRPELTRALLRYRHRRLPMARALASELGFRGAIFPWQSGSSGCEETPPVLYNPRMDAWMPDNSHHQRHVGLEVALSVWRYFQFTHDGIFMRDVGAELILDAARGYASMATYDAATGRYSVHHTMGPDEFHDGYPSAPGEGLTDNAYNNVLASWVMTKALEIYDYLDDVDAAVLRAHLNLTDEDLRRLDDVSRNLRLVFHDDGVLSQFDGYEDLEEFDWEGYREKYGNIGRLDLILAAEGDSPNNYKVSKQADVAMLFYVFAPDELADILDHMGYSLDEGAIQRTISYYRERTSDGSMLSQIVYAWAINGYSPNEAWPLYQQALEADIDNEAGSSTAEGIHTGVMAGTVDYVQRCLAGMSVRGRVLRLRPALPDAVDNVAFRIYYRGCPVQVKAAHERVEVRVEDDAKNPVTVEVNGDRRKLFPGDHVEFAVA